MVTSTDILLLASSTSTAMLEDLTGSLRSDKLSFMLDGGGGPVQRRSLRVRCRRSDGGEQLFSVNSVLSVNWPERGLGNVEYTGI